MSFRGGAFKTIIGCLALLGASDLLGRGIRAAMSYHRSLGPPAGVTFDEPLVSPDGQFKVVEFGASGGGGISPYCDEQFSILRAAEPTEAAWQEANIIASLPCAGISVGGVRHGVTWIGDHRLRVVFDLTAALQNGQVKLKAHSATGEAYVEYATQENPYEPTVKASGAQPSAKPR